MWLWIWLTSAFAVSVLASLRWGVRGAIVSFAIGGLLPLAPQSLGLVNHFLDPSSVVDIGPGLGFVDGAAFMAAYWWLVAYPAAAIGLTVRSRFSRRRVGKVF